MQKEITETLISFKTAKLAKEKGFNIPYPAFFHIENGKTVEYNYVYTSILTSQFHDIKEGGNLKSITYFSRPTQDLLQKWLREVHNIHFITKPYIESLGKKEITGYYIPTICTSFLDKYIEFDDNYSTYEEALDEGLYSALLLL